MKEHGAEKHLAIALFLREQCLPWDIPSAHPQRILVSQHTFSEGPYQYTAQAEDMV